ncbi:hypothetical protein BS47DRAFT_1366393 [Hydnum rufescens UP504]|uniref:Uncharacterized protein n=1 Tax=Hydnum rufescens UP504 TaxID=1448309 RepID=A0A9P6AL88_9AGAM|nr:hypothetical protein BS47DRAFT_1366393 [Hydnum rufescens UP504]
MPISRLRKVDFNQARIDAWNSPDYNIPIYEPGHRIALDRQTHTNPPPAPARTDDDDTGKEEAPHTHCGGGVTLDRQTHTNPTPAPARTDDDDYRGEIHECAQPRETPMIDYLPPIKRGLKYGATHPLKRVCGNIRYSTHTPASAGPFPKRKPAQQRHARALNTKFNAQLPKPRVLNTTMDLISYHTPAAAGVLLIYETPQQEQSQGPR